MRVSLAVLCAMIPLAAQAAPEGMIADTLTVHSDAITKVAPDQVTVSISVRDENVDAKTAKWKQDEKLRKLLDLGQAAGIDKAHTSTGYTSLAPQYEWDSFTQKQRFKTYQATTSVEFVLTDITHLAGFTQSVVDAGIVDTVGNVYYSLQNEKAVQEDTLVKAMEHAAVKASRIAAAAHVVIEKPLVIEEGMTNNNIPFAPRPMMGMAMAKKMNVESEPPELPSGIIEIHETVTVTYQIKPQ